MIINHFKMIVCFSGAESMLSFWPERHRLYAFSAEAKAQSGPWFCDQSPKQRTGRVCRRSYSQGNLRAHVQMDRAANQQVFGQKQTTGNLVHWHTRHCWLWDISSKQCFRSHCYYFQHDFNMINMINMIIFLLHFLAEFFRTIMHKLHEWKIATTLQPYHVHPWTRRVQTRRSRVEVHRFWPRPSTHNWPYRKSKHHFEYLLDQLKLQIDSMNVFTTMFFMLFVYLIDVLI